MYKNLLNNERVCHPKAESLPERFIFPKTYLEYINSEEGYQDYTPWNFLCYEDPNSIESWLHDDQDENDEPEEYLNFFELAVDVMNRRYPNRQLVPFANNGLELETACFVPSEDPSQPFVYCINNESRPSYEIIGKWNTFEEWLKDFKAYIKQYQIDNPDFADSYDYAARI